MGQRNDMKTIFNNDRGSVMVAAVLILVLLTIIGFAATNMSTNELNVSTNTLLYERAFYTATAALEHAKETLRVPFSEQIKAGGEEQWDFALVGIVDTNGDGKGSYEEGRELLKDLELDGVRYTVTIWNNDDGGSPTDDQDGRIFVRADAEEVVRGGRCSIEELIEGTANGGPTSNYTAQEGAGSGKAYTADDTNPVEMNLDHDGDGDVDNSDYITIM